jgi:HAD superfamily hydrolase (TIGR01509 family)
MPHHLKEKPLNSFFDGVFFDMDGLMVDSEPQWLISETQLTGEYGYAWTSQDQVACLGGPLTRVGEYMYEKCKRAQSPEFFTKKIIEIQSQRMQEHTPLMPGALELVRDLQENGVKTGLVSASPRIIVDAVLDQIGRDLFPFSITSDDVVNTKPHPDAYIKAASISDSDISNCLIFEDSLTGVQAAVNSGAWLIAVPHLVVVEESARVRSITSLRQLDFFKLTELKKDFSSAI